MRSRTWLVLWLLSLLTQARADESTLTLAQGSRAHRPAVAADAQGRVHVVYEGYDQATKVIEIFHALSGDGGKTWGDPVNLSRTPGTSARPCLCLDTQGAVCVAWIDTTSGEDRPDIFFARSTDGGAHWSAAVDISKTPGVSSQPAIAAGPDGSLHVVWIDTSSGRERPDVWYSVSQDHGQTWSSGQNLSHTPGVSGSPAIAVGPEGTVHVVWVDTTSGQDRPDIFYVSGHGGSFGKVQNLSNTPGVSSQPRVAAAGDQVYVAWIDSTLQKEAPDVFLVRRQGQGAFSPPVDISKTPGISSDPALAADDHGHVAVVWVDNYRARKPDVYVASSQDSGQSFGPPVNLSRARENTQLPNVAWSGKSIVAVWEELVDGLSVIKLTSVRGRTP